MLITSRLDQPKDANLVTNQCPLDQPTFQLQLLSQPSLPFISTRPNMHFDSTYPFISTRLNMHLDSTKYACWLDLSSISTWPIAHLDSICRPPRLWLTPLNMQSPPHLINQHSINLPSWLYQDSGKDLCPPIQHSILTLSRLYLNTLYTCKTMHPDWTYIPFRPNE